VTIRVREGPPEKYIKRLTVGGPRDPRDLAAACLAACLAAASSQQGARGAQPPLKAFSRHYRSLGLVLPPDFGLAFGGKKKEGKN